MISVVNGRSVADIKRGLMCCDVKHSCYECPYNPPGAAECEMTSAIDALAYIGALEHELDKLQNAYESAQPKWISVVEREPELGVEVLTCDGYNNIHVAYRTSENLYYRDGVDGYLAYFSASYWMPLPSAPKEEA